MRKIVLGLGVPVGITLLLYGLGQIPGQAFQIALGATLGGNALYWGYKKVMHASLLEQWEEEQGGNAVNRSIGLNEAMESLKTWSQENYVGNNEVKFQWDLTKFDTTVEKDPQSGDEYLFYAFVTIGENNRMVLAVVEGKDGEIVTHEPIRYQGQERHPFEYSSIVKELRKNKFRTQNDDLMDDFGQWRNVYQGGGRGGMPRGGRGGQPVLDRSQQQPMPAQNTSYTEVEDDGDNSEGGDK